MLACSRYQDTIEAEPKPCSEKPTSSSSMYPALQNQKMISSGVISVERSTKTAKNNPSMMAKERVEKSCLAVYNCAITTSSSGWRWYGLELLPVVLPQLSASLGSVESFKGIEVVAQRINQFTKIEVF
ncbi:hypothetical protein KCU92_g56, partial [Aureobasidium melanogenum]